MKKVRMILLAMAVGSMTVFTACGPSAEDQAKMQEELETTLTDALEDVAEETDVVAEQEVVTDTVATEVVETEEVPAEEVPAE